MTPTLLLLSILPHAEPVRDRCDIVEENAYYDDSGKLVFIQIVFWNDTNSGYRVADWRMQRMADGTEIKTARDWKHGGYVARWNDKGTEREVRAQTFHDSYTQVDVELLDRDYLPKERRRLLSNPK